MITYFPILRLSWLDTKACDWLRNSSGRAPRGIQRTVEQVRIRLRAQNLVTSVKLKSRTFIAGTTMSNDSSPLARTGTLIASTLDSM
jgi:hypothetical protein